MKNVFFLGLVIVLFLSSTSPAHADNLLVNPGFETWGPWGPGGLEVPADWWHMFSDPNVIGTKESVVKDDGSFSGKIELSGTAGAWGGWGQRIPFMAGDALYVYQSVYIPTALEGDRSLATLEIAFESAPDVTIGPVIKSSMSAATGGWTAWQGVTGVPVGTTSVRYSVLMETWGDGSGTAYFDDGYASNTPFVVPEPASMLLLGSGLLGLFGIVRKKN